MNRKQLSQLINKYHQYYKQTFTASDFAKLFFHYAKARSNVYIFPFASFISLLLGSKGNPDPLIAFHTMASCYVLALATYVYNDATDLRVDRINHTNRPSVTGTPKNQLVILASILYGLSLVLAMSINLYAMLIMLTCIAMGIAYSHPMVNLKEIFPLKTLLTAAGAGLSSFYGGIAADSAVMLPEVYAALSFFAFFFILGPLGDIGDLKGDRAVGRRTFPITIGVIPTFTIMLSIPIAIISTTILLTFLDIVHMGTAGLAAIIGACSITMVLLLQISKKLDHVSFIKSSRHKMRILHVSLQISLLPAFL